MPVYLSRFSSRQRVRLVLLCFLSVATMTSGAQEILRTSTEPGHTQINALAERLASQCLAAHKKKLIVLDLTLPESKESSLGTLLADQISESLEQSHPELEVIPRSKWKSALENGTPSKDLNERTERNKLIAKAIGAKLMVQGMFCAVPGGIGITLTASDWQLGGRASFEALSEIPLTSEMQSLLLAPLPERPTVDGIYRAGVGGIGTPVCKKCLDPQYPDSLRSKKIEGKVLLEVVITPEGKADRIRVTQLSSPELADSAVKAVRKWQFKPALNSRGEPVPVFVPIELNFRLLR